MTTRGALPLVDGLQCGIKTEGEVCYLRLPCFPFHFLVPWLHFYNNNNNNMAMTKRPAFYFSESLF